MRRAAMQQPGVTNEAAGPAVAPLRLTEPVHLSIRNVSKRWGAATPVLQHVDLDIAKGTLVALVGRNGAGKTTLLRIVAGLIAPDEGTVAVDGLDPFANRREFQQRLGVVSAGHGGLYARLTVRQHLECWSRLAFIPRRERAGAVAAVIEDLDLGDKAGSRVDRLSAGQRQRVRMAMAFMHRPSLVLLDEPQTSLDDEGVAVLETLIRSRVEDGGSVVCCAPTAAALGFPVESVYRVGDGQVVPE